MRKTNRRNGILGGSFDPPHLGHLLIALRAKKQLKLDEVVFIPASDPPHRKPKLVLSPRHRLAMTRLLVKGVKGLLVSDIEIRRGGRSYTVDTLRSFRKRHPRSELFLLLGSDNYKLLKTWKDPEEIRTLATIAVYPRGRALRTSDKIDRRDRFLRGAPFPISSSKIRRWVAGSRGIDGWVVPSIERYIQDHKIYARTGRSGKRR